MYSLGDHFMNVHGNYEELVNLKSADVSCDISYNIMIKNLTIKKTNLCYKTREICPICNCAIFEKNETNVEAPCKFRKPLVMFNDDMRLIQTDTLEIKNSKLLEVIDEFKKGKEPTSMKCCKRIICKECVMNIVSTTKKYRCPFCMRDHKQQLF